MQSPELGQVLSLPYQLIPSTCWRRAIKVRSIQRDALPYRGAFMPNPAVQHSRPEGRRYQSLTSAVSTILKEEGASGLYRGLSPNLIGNGLAWGLYFFSYDIIHCICRIQFFHLQISKCKTVFGGRGTARSGVARSLIGGLYCWCFCGVMYKSYLGTSNHSSHTKHLSNQISGNQNKNANTDGWG